MNFTNFRQLFDKEQREDGANLDLFSLKKRCFLVNNEQKEKLYLPNYTVLILQ